jgi:hypothetical protein
MFQSSSSSRKAVFLFPWEAMGLLASQTTLEITVDERVNPEYPENRFAVSSVSYY